MLNLIGETVACLLCRLLSQDVTLVTWEGRYTPNQILHSKARKSFSIGGAERNFGGPDDLPPNSETGNKTITLTNTKENPP